METGERRRERDRGKQRERGERQMVRPGRDIGKAGERQAETRKSQKE